MLSPSRLAVVSLTALSCSFAACSSVLDFDELSANKPDASTTNAPDAGGAAGEDAATGGRGGTKAEGGTGGRGNTAGAAGRPRAGGSGGATGSSVIGGTGGATGTSGSSASDDDAGIADPATFSCGAQTGEVTLCDDFEGQPLTAVWTDVILRPSESTADAGVVEINDADAVSPSHSLLTAVHAGLDPASDLALGVGKNIAEFGGMPIHVELDFETKVEQFDDRPDRTLIAMQATFGLSSTGWYGQLMLVLQSTPSGVQMYFAEADIPVVNGIEMRQSTVHAAQTLPNDTWTHVHFAFDVSNQAGHSHQAQVTVAGKVLYDGQLSYTPRMLSPRLELGAPWVDHAAGSRAWRLRYDNVLLRVTAL